MRKHFPNAACFLLEEQLTTAQATTALCACDMEIIVTATFKYQQMRPILTSHHKPIDLVILSHGRSGKKGASADFHRQLGANGKPIRDGSLTAHDWSYDPDCYNHFDGFLRNGGSFINPIPDLDRPRVLILPTWSAGENGANLLKDNKWAEVFADLSDKCELVLAPHPLAEQRAVQRFLDLSGARLLETAGHSFEEVPAANCIVCDLSGVFWESLLFDTPVILAMPESGCSWPDDLPPTCAEMDGIVPFVQVANLVPTVKNMLGKRSPHQARLAAMRLGSIDGQATARIVKRISMLLEKKGARAGDARSRSCFSPMLISPR